MIAAEYEAIQLYTQLAESIDHKLAQEVLLDISNEERNTRANSPPHLRCWPRTSRAFMTRGWGKPMKRLTS